MDHIGTPDLVRATLTQGQQPGHVIDLAVHQHNRPNRRITHRPRRLQHRRLLQLGTNVGGSVAENPVHPVIRQGNGRLGTRFRVQRATAQAVAVAAVTVPLRKTTASS